ncbi:MAG: sigma-70 family RNA polymerase sigma factor, partial [Lachnospiraceae bacterium]|nr:sigma-70 family RNA polymerase sigma factor [Lachnospiraceae bacterium]
MDKQEYIRLVEKYYEDIKRVAFAGCKDMYDAEDITQTAFMKLLKTSESFEEDENIKKWLIRVAVNEYKSLWR